MAAPAREEFRRASRLLDRALRVVEDASHSLRQKLLARELGRTLPATEWERSATDEPGLTAEDLRRHAAEVRTQTT